MALRAFREAEFDFCAEALSESSAVAGLTLRARALLRRGRFDEALSVVESLDVATLSHDDAGEVLALKASALCGLRAPEADAVLLEARVRAYSSGCAAVECEVEYATALLAWTQGRTADALSAIETVLTVSEQQPTWLRKSRPEASCSAAHWRSRAFELRGMTQALQEDFSGQATSLVKAFYEFDQGRVEDVFIESQFLLNLAILAPDVEDSEISIFVAERAERVAWNSQTAFFEFAVFNALGWCYARRGDHLGAFRHLRRSADVAPSLPLRITAILDRGFLARELGEVLTASDDLEHAIRLTSRVDWERASGGERTALYSLAKQIAPTDPKRARQLWDRFVALKSLVSPFELSSSGNRRERAEQCSAHAAVLLAEGQRQRAISLLLESFEIWTEVGYRWRAATVAADLAELTGEARFFDVAAAQAEKQPHSWLARRLTALSSRETGT